MSLETELVTAITGDGTLAALIAARLYPARLPDDVTFPAMAYSVVSQTPSASEGCTRSRVQIDSYAASYAVLKSLRDGLIALANITGTWTYQGGPDFFEDDSKVFRQVVDVFISHEV